MSVLAKICADKRLEVQRTKARLPESVLRERLGDAAPVRDFVGTLRASSAPRVIAEVKRASPSKGVLRAAQGRNQGPMAWRPVELAQAYERAGAAALSVLTDGPYFWGSADTLVACRAGTALPVLRKDFIVEPYQVDEARWLGADALLLMASVLEGDELAQCAQRAFELGLAVLFESHTEAQLERVLSLSAPPQRSLIGINHRDLTTLEMNMDRARQLKAHVPDEYLVVAESGLQTHGDLVALINDGIETFLIGGHIAASDDPEGELRRMRGG